MMMAVNTTLTCTAREKTTMTNNTQTVTEYRATLNAAIDARALFEASKSADNHSMQDTLKAFRKDVDHDDICKVMLASNVDASFINRSERVNARFNVYAAQKVANVARFAASVDALNHYTLAIVKTAFALEAQKLALTHKDAVAACSASVKHADAKREAIIAKHRYAKHVAANTASTQSSSSINALQMCNVLSEARDASNVITYTLNRKSEAYKRIAKALELK